MRPLGLLVDNNGLQLSMNDHDKVCPRPTRLFLTNSPTRVLDFLGLSHANGEWKRPFKTVAELVEYVKTCRFYNPRGPFTKGPLKAKFLRYQPQLFGHLEEQAQKAESGPEKSPPATLVDVRRAVFSTFPGTEEAYAAEVAKWNLAKQRNIWVESIKHIIKTDYCLPRVIHARFLPPVPEGGSIEDVERAWRAVLRAALRRLLLSGDSPAQMLLCVQPPKFDYTTELPVVMDWIKRHWRKIGEEAWGRVQRQLAWRHDQASEVAPGEHLVKFSAPKQIWQTGPIAIKRLKATSQKTSVSGETHNDSNNNNNNNSSRAAAQQDEGPTAQAKSEVALDSATQHNESTAVQAQSEAASDSPRGEQQS